MATAGRGAAKLSCVAIGTLRVSAQRARCRFWDPTRLQTVLFGARSGGSLTTTQTAAPQGFCHARAMQQCRKRQHLRPLRPKVSWHLATMRVHLGVPPEKGGAGLENPSMYQMYALASRRHRLCGAGWQSVRVSMAGGAWGSSDPPVWYIPVFEPAPSATFIGGAAICPVRSIAMNTSDFRSLHAQYDPDNAEPEREPSVDPNAFVATLHRIGTGAAADGQPWPERHQLPGRRLQLADADCALAGLRVVAELMLAAERTRQNGAPEEYLGDRVMEGLKMACVALTAQVAERLHVRE